MGGVGEDDSFFEPSYGRTVQIFTAYLWREKACVKELGTRTFEPLGQGYGHGVERHAAFALKAKNAREVSMRKDALVELTSESDQIGAMPHVSKRRRLDASLSSGRIDLPAFMFREFPRGFCNVVI